ncbi:unnamed protein product [Blepharisma stoltei]|uniref:Uncharacterized protein n=1 Tax=Blepharisma stoltei TaxID=1481888 RepID=A0AAU9IXR5_9CILI|nr:unnamed protein product [Blepharisma stoltei]
MSTWTIRIEDKEGNSRSMQVNSSWTYAQLHGELLNCFRIEMQLQLWFIIIILGTSIWIWRDQVDALWNSWAFGIAA